MRLIDGRLEIRDLEGQGGNWQAQMEEATEIGMNAVLSVPRNPSILTQFEDEEAINEDDAIIWRSVNPFVLSILSRGEEEGIGDDDNGDE